MSCKPATDAVFKHVGSNTFDPNRFNHIAHQREGIKPRGGLWACPVGSDYSWEDYLITESYNLHNLDKSFLFTLDPQARILVINTITDIDEFVTYGSNGLIKAINFNSIFENWDAIHLTADGLLSEVRPKHKFLFAQNTAFTQPFYDTWCCETLIVNNPEIIVQC